MAMDIEDRRIDDLVSGRAAARLRAFRRQAEELFPGRVTQVILFGSRARGDARRKSDYDVAVFIKELGERRPVDHALAGAAYKYMLQGYHINPISVPSDFLVRVDKTPLAYALEREGVPIR